MKNILFTIALTVIVLLSSFTPADKRDLRINTVVIDAGHGGKDTGTVGAISKEKDVALKIALDLGKTINEYLKDVKVIYTRSTDEFIELEQRAEIANKNSADLFISIHANSVPRNTSDERKASIYGTETYVMGLHTSEANFEVAKRENSVILLEPNNKKYMKVLIPTPLNPIYYFHYTRVLISKTVSILQKK